MSQQPESGSDEDSREFKKIYGLAFVFVLVLVIGTPWIVSAFRWVAPGGAEQGQFGDQFGFTNALFSGLALAGVVIAILLQSRQLEMQSHELELQRKELELTRWTLESQRGELARQAQLMSKQSIESSFFQLLGRLDSVCETAGIGNGHEAGSNFGPTDAFVAIDEATGLVAFDEVAYALNREDRVAETWFAEFADSDWSQGLRPYVRTIQLLLYLLDSMNAVQNEGVEDAAFYYAAVLRSQLTDNELAVINAFGKHSSEFDDIAGLIDKFLIS